MHIYGMKEEISYQTILKSSVYVLFGASFLVMSFFITSSGASAIISVIFSMLGSTFVSYGANNFTAISRDGDDEIGPAVLMDTENAAIRARNGTVYALNSLLAHEEKSPIELSGDGDLNVRDMKPEAVPRFAIKQRIKKRFQSITDLFPILQETGEINRMVLFFGFGACLAFLVFQAHEALGLFIAFMIHIALKIAEANGSYPASFLKNLSGVLDNRELIAEEELKALDIMLAKDNTKDSGNTVLKNKSLQEINKEDSLLEDIRKNNLNRYLLFGFCALVFAGLSTGAYLITPMAGTSLMLGILQQTALLIAPFFTLFGIFKLLSGSPVVTSVEANSKKLLENSKSVFERVFNIAKDIQQGSNNAQKNPLFKPVEVNLSDLSELKPIIGDGKSNLADSKLAIDIKNAIADRKALIDRRRRTEFLISAIFLLPAFALLTSPLLLSLGLIPEVLLSTLGSICFTLALCYGIFPTAKVMEVDMYAYEAALVKSATNDILSGLIKKNSASSEKSDVLEPGINRTLLSKMKKRVEDNHTRFEKWDNLRNAPTFLLESVLKGKIFLLVLILAVGSQIGGVLLFGGSGVAAGLLSGAGFAGLASALKILYESVSNSLNITTNSLVFETYPYKDAPTALVCEINSLDENRGVLMANLFKPDKNFTVEDTAAKSQDLNAKDAQPTAKQKETKGKGPSTHVIITQGTVTQLIAGKFIDQQQPSVAAGC